jgi:hypothetical protein
MAHKVTVASVPTGTVGVKLPNGQTYIVGQSAVLTDEQFALLNPLSLTDGTLTDNGVTGPSGDQVTTQGVVVTAPAALTSSQVVSGTVTLPNLAVAYNALQVDVAALRTTLAALITSLTVAGGALA